ncbi:hypothetical protein NDU88_006794 [Pleurodeles waltl]|uniref:Uncharacterized protein n=1 Tax=Pleurodeles waltl TaxID=8319 RepID=A0AAV7MF29_PLEWA|nr:hypothetical protein NDU88_006794 [Pleurodeles waltl]
MGLPHIGMQWDAVKRLNRGYAAAKMGRDKAVRMPAQQQKIDKYAKQSAPGNEVGAVGGTPEPWSLAQTAAILEAINDLIVTMEGKMGELSVDLALIRQNLRNTTNRVTEVEGRL